ncbi:cytidine deaminase [bacterium]|nr:cytidine deaminase [bacterium]
MKSELLQHAITQSLAVRNRSYSPYSQFKVGAALITKSGNIFVGTNVENGSYGATVCAERIALFSAVSAGEREFETLIVTADMDGKAVYPCGLCLQVFSEFAPQIPVVLVNASTGKIEKETTLDTLFPHQFSLNS